MRHLHLAFVGVLIVGACSPDETRPLLPFEPQPQPDPLACVGTAEERGDSLRSVLERVGDGSFIQLGACEYFVKERLLDAYDDRAGIPYNSGIVLHDVSDLTIQGAGSGRTVVRFARPVYVGLEIGSNVTNLTVTDLTIAGSIVEGLCALHGDLPNCYGDKASSYPNTHGIGSSARRLGIRGIRFSRLEVRDLAVGISVGVWGGSYCDYSDVTIENNEVHDIHGTFSGSGYGIHVGCATGVTVRDNSIRRAGRHAIYIGRSPASNPQATVVIRNTIIDHGHAELMDYRMAAIALARADNVFAIDNTLIRSHTYSISVNFDPDTGLDCTRCVVIGNRFVGTGEVEDIWVDSKAPTWLWGNVGGRGQAATLRDDSGMAMDAAGTGQFWSGTQAVASTSSTSPAGDHLYVLQNGVLHMVRSDYGATPDVGWRDFRSMAASWPDVVGMTSGGGQVYLWQGGALHAITPSWANGTWASAAIDGWQGSGEIEYGTGGLLYLIKDNGLYTVDPDDGFATQWKEAANEVRSLGVGRNAAYMRLVDGVYALELGTANSSLRVVD